MKKIKRTIKRKATKAKLGERRPRTDRPKGAEERKAELNRRRDPTGLMLEYLVERVRSRASRETKLARKANRARKKGSPSGRGVSGGKIFEIGEALVEGSRSQYSRAREKPRRRRTA